MPDKTRVQIAKAKAGRNLDRSADPPSYSQETFIRRQADMANVVGERFQITIDRVVRERLGIEPGDLAVEHIEDGRLVVEFMPRPHDRSLRGILKRVEVPPVTTDSAAEKEAAWVARGGEVMAALEADSARHGGRGRARGG